MRDEKHYTDDAPHATAEDYRCTGERFAEAMRKEFPVDLTVSTACARCSATIDLAAVEQHHERCFVVGDWVRWEYSAGSDNWVEGDITAIGYYMSIDIKRFGPGRTQRLGVQDFGRESLGAVIRHIQRPGQAVREAQERYTLGSPLNAEPPMQFVDYELQDAMERVALPSEDPWEQDPMDALYDGVTLRLLVEQDEMRQRTERPLGQFEPLTPAQRAAVSAHWSQQLRARISAAKERERLRVRVDDQGEP